MKIDQYWNSLNWVSVLLWPLSVLFRVLVFFRILGYRSGLLKSYRVKKPVIIIGNLTVGGSGKTPLIIELIKQCESCGYKAGVISRGYGGDGPWPQRLNMSSTAASAGDEPVQIFQRTGAEIVVGPDRVKDANFLIEQSDVDLILADDGLQHYRLERDHEVVVIDQQKMFGNGLMLPAGPLREPVSRLTNSSDCWTVFNGGTQSYSYQIMPGDVIELVSAEKKSLMDFAGQKVHAVAAIGNPERFFTMLEQHDIKVIRHVFPDHHRFKQDDLQFKDDLPVLMTEKDSVKCKDFQIQSAWYVAINIILTEKFINDFKQKIDGLVNG